MRGKEKKIDETAKRVVEMRLWRSFVWFLILCYWAENLKML